MKKGAVLILLIFGFNQLSAVASEETESEEAQNLIKHCQKLCKKAKTAEKIHKCVEKKGRLNKAFRKTKCWEVNEIYEKKREESE